MRRLFVLPVIAVLLVTLGACGSKEETSTSASSTTAAAKSSSDSTSTTKATSSTDDTGDTDATDDIPSLPGNLGECSDIATVYSSVMAQSIILMSPGASQDDLDKLAGELESAKANVPDDIKDAFDTWSSAWDSFAEDMKDINQNGGLTNPANLDKLQAASDKLEDPEVKAASDEIEAYLKDTCGI